MAQVDPTQLAIGAAIVAGVYLVYNRSKVDPFTATYTDEFDPNWKGGRVTEAPTALQFTTAKRPVCQKFDNVSYLYMDANIVDGATSSAECFARGGERYVDALNAISFPGELTEVTSAMAGQNTTQGTCYFPITENTFFVKPAQAIVNGSARLCFAGNGHHFTRRSDNTTFYSPQISLWGTPPPGPNYCERLQSYNGWAHSDDSAQYDDSPLLCAAASSGSSQFRYRNGIENKFVYKNPFTGSLVEDPFH